MADKRTQYERTSRERATMKAAAQLLGWQVLDILGAYLTPEGETVVITRDGKRYGASPRPVGDLPTAPAMPEDEVSARRQKKVYAPKSWDPSKWNGVVTALREQDFTKDEARRELANAKTLDAKQIRHALAVVDAMPDAPDWYAHMPVAEV